MDATGRQREDPARRRPRDVHGAMLDPYLAPDGRRPGPRHPVRGARPAAGRWRGSMRSDSRSISTRSATGRCASGSTPSRAPGGQRIDRHPAAPQPHPGHPSGRHRALPRLDALANVSRTGPPRGHMDELTLPFSGPLCRRGSTRSVIPGPGHDLAMGSDWSVSTADPLPQIEIAVNRGDPRPRGDQRARSCPRRAIELDRGARRRSPPGSAYASHLDEAGTIAVGPPGRSRRVQQRPVRSR